jgi:type I restriction enzyme M protein
MKELLQNIGFSPKENIKGIFIKKYSIFDDYIIEVDFENKKINYGNKINIGSKTTQNFSQDENWVVLECVNRLLEKGYHPKDITLEKVYPTGHGTSGRLDILVKKDKEAFLMIECKTWSREFEKEFSKLQKNGGQLFTYFQQDTNTENLILYTSRFNKNEIEFKNEIIKIEDDYREAGNVKDLYDRWNKLTKTNGIFDNWVNAYEFKTKSLFKKDLKPLTKEDSSSLFNKFDSILRKHSVSDHPNAFNKIFNLFLAKIFDEKKRDNDELDFQWKE